MKRVARNENLIVAKAGGTSLATKRAIGRIVKIAEKDQRRRIFIFSAPGRRNNWDSKVTDLLEQCFNLRHNDDHLKTLFAQVRDRFMGIAESLGVTTRWLELALTEIEKQIPKEKRPDFTMSRGEHLMAQLMAKYLGFDFVDAPELIFFRRDGRLNKNATNLAIRAALKDKKRRVVVPGYYGARHRSGKIQTFERGGSDTTSAIIARALRPALLENWTDANGFHRADPRIVPHAQPIRRMSFDEAVELTEAGASVFSDVAAAWLARCNVPVQVRNTFDFRNPGTLILPNGELGEPEFENNITGVTSRCGFLAIKVSKLRIRDQVGFARDVLNVLADAGISIEHMPSGKSDVGFIVPETSLPDLATAQMIKRKINARCRAEKITIDYNLALVTTVGRGMVRRPGVSGVLYTALGNAGINVRASDQGASELAITTAVATEDEHHAVRTIHDAFC